MLVLTRKTGQKLIIDDNIEIIILETKGEAVKIGIKAPKNVAIFREEIYEEIKKANEQSGKNALLSDLDVAFNLFGKKENTEDNSLNKFQSIINRSKKNTISEK
ncbi:MAG: carbon storage regulator CsrA [Candidatus Gastranaerophilales bacterium]|nr:carbon storage regulator CsrA [Candidatus Gastranaerophilales bacterium]